MANDSYLDKQWNLDKVQAPEAWQVTSGNPAILIAVLDTGIDREHEDLAGKVVADINFTDSLTSDDVYGHGTHVAGIIAALADNGAGVTGVGYSCRLLNVKVAGDEGRCDGAAVAKGIIWATDNGADVINLSLFLTEPSLELAEAVDYAWSKGVVLVAAAGNYMGTHPVYPACYPNCMAVAATDDNDLLALWSSRGDWVDVAAPGANVYSTLPGDEYSYKSGTSIAAAHVSGEAGLLLAVTTDTDGNGKVNDEVRAKIEGSCDQIGIAGVGNGRINAFKAVN